MKEVPFPQQLTIRPTGAAASKPTSCGLRTVLHRWGNTGDVLFEFSEIGDSFIQGEEAFKMLKNLYKQEYQQEKKRRDEEYNQFGTDKEILDKLKKQRGKK